jgi:hypothetical protein
MSGPHGGPIVCAVFGTLLGALLVGLLFSQRDPLPDLLLGGASALSFLTAVVLEVRERRPPKPLRADPDLSLGAVALAFGIAGLIVGAEVGTWMLLISAGVLAGAIMQLARERRVQREAVRRRRATAPRGRTP